ncbi:MAG: S41 family peptidase, partial [bacterium]
LEADQVIIKSTYRDIDPNTYTGITKDTTYRATDNGQAKQRPFIFLVDNNSASAAEILASAVKDNRNDIILMGQSTYGKARGQIWRSTIEQGLMTITMMKLTTSRDIDYNLVGLKPHVDLSNESNWLEKAYERALFEMGKSSRIGAKALAKVKTDIGTIELNRRLITQFRKTRPDFLITNY